MLARILWICSPLLPASPMLAQPFSTVRALINPSLAVDMNSQRLDQSVVGESVAHGSG
jgi:hypothetical protein